MPNTMTSVLKELIKYSCFFLLILVLFSGCANGVRRVASVPNNGDVADLNSDDIVLIMQHAGFTDEQILKQGTDLRNVIAMQGGAYIRIGKKVEAIFAVQPPDYIHVVSRITGANFTYNFKTGELK